MISSIRWTLLVWYALILAAVVAGFGGTLYRQMHHAMTSEVDAALRAHGRTLSAALVAPEPGLLALALPPGYEEQFKKDGRDAGYFLVWDSSGRRVAGSRFAPAVQSPPAPRGAGRRGDKPWASQRDAFHELNLPGPHGSLIVVARRVEEDRRRLAQLLAATVGSGAIVLLLGLVGGCVLAARTLAPIDTMSRDAEAISETNLSQRIDVRHTKSELGRLAAVLNAAFDRLASALQRQVRFTADASHELRTPLAVIVSTAELALRRPRSEQEYQEKLATCLQAARRMQSLVESMLHLARIESPAAFTRQVLELDGLVAAVADELAPLAEQSTVSLKVHVDPCRVEGDETELRSVVANLLYNAVQYNRRGGTVDVSLDAAGDQAVLTVTDTGVGIAEADLPHIFERFYRVDKARSRTLGGSGLGLAIVKAAVEAHGGHVEVESRQDQGTTFRVRLPAASAALAPPVAPPA